MIKMSQAWISYKCASSETRLGDKTSKLFQVVSPCTYIKDCKYLHGIILSIQDFDKIDALQQYVNMYQI